MTNRKIKITLSLLILLFTILFTSCENFLKSKDVSDELNRKIAYANAPKTTVKMRVDNSDYGDIYPPSVTVAEGDTFEVEFTQKQAAVFKYWMITNPQTGEELGEDCLVITAERLTSNNAEKTITRKITVQVNSLPEDAEIRPKCYFPTEQVPPEFLKLNIARNEADVLAGTNLITVEDNPVLNTFEHYADKQYYGEDDEAATVAVKANIEAHHVNSIWIDLEGYDANSGVDEVEIQEKLLRDTAGQESLNNNIYTKTYQLVSDQNSKESSAKLTINHTFKCTEDGVVRVFIILRDKSGNETVKAIDLIKDTYCDVSATLTSADQNYILKAASENNKATYNLMITLGCDSWGSFIKDMNGKSYDDGNYYLDSETKDFSGHARLVNVAIGYSGEALTEYAADDFDYTYYYSSSRGYSPYCMLDIEVDALKDTVVKTTVQDSAGNTKVVEHIIEKASIPDYVEVSGTSFTVYSRALTLYPNYRVYFVFTGTDGEVITDNVNLFNSNGKVSTSKFKNKTGTIAVYLLKAGIKCSYIYSLGYKPYIIYQGMEPEHVENLDNCAIPSFTYTIDPPVSNKGTRTLHINYESGFEFKPNIKYIFKFATSSKSYIFSSQTIELPSSEEYTPGIFLVNEKNEKKEQMGSEQDKFTLEYDNISPDLPIDKSDVIEVVFPETRILYLGKNKSFDLGGLKHDENGNMTIKYVSSSNANLLQMGINWNDTSIVKEYTQKLSTNTLYLPFDGDYSEYCYVHLEDIQGNSNDLCFKVENNYREKQDGYKKPKIEYKKNQAQDAIRLLWDKDAEPRLYSTVSTNVTSFYLDNGEWKLLNINSGDTFFLDNDISRTYYNNPTNPSQGTSYYKIEAITENGNQYYQYFYFPLESVEKQSFIKTYLWLNSGGRTGYEYGYYWDTLYFYAPYALLSDPSNYSCNLKNYYESSIGLVVLADKPCLVHTMYCSVDLGDKQEWLNRGIEAKAQSSTSSFTYTEPLDKIPAGKYYTTIIHFADGDFCMMPVKIK